MKKQIFIAVSALTLAVLACSPITVNVPQLTTGPTETLEVDEPLPDSESVVDVTLEMGAGELRLDGGASSLVEGEIRYNVPDWEPKIENSGDSLLITQGDSEFNGIPGGDVINKWTLELGDAPMNLTIHAGAYEGNFDLSGVRLRNLTINDGASDSEVTFDSVNPEEMEKLEYSSGASSVKMTGLANANFEEMEFSGGAGDYTLDFSGDLQRDATVRVKGGVGEITIIVPEDVKATVSVTKGVGSVDTDGSWTVAGDEYSTGAKEGPELTIYVEMGVGSLNLVSK